MLLGSHSSTCLQSLLSRLTTSNETWVIAIFDGCVLPILKDARATDRAVLLGATVGVKDHLMTCTVFMRSNIFEWIFHLVDVDEVICTTGLRI